MEESGGRLKGILAAIGLLVLIFDSSCALEGAGAGIELCIRTVIPSLFPFFVLSSLLTDGLSDTSFRSAGWLTRLLGIPQSAVPVLLTAVLGGYPVGAKCVGELYHSGQMDRNQAERMLAFCSNAGPSFLFGMVSVYFPERKWIWLLWMIVIFSAVLTAAGIPAVPIHEQKSSIESRRETPPAILSAAKAIGVVCCWVVLFRMILSFLDSWFLWLLPGWVQVLLSGFLELTNGCFALPLIADLNLRFILCAVMLSFGGICVLLQTASVTHGLSLGCYIRGKLIQTAFSLLLSIMVVSRYRLLVAMLVPFFVMILRKTQNRYRNPAILPV